jgi:hypothetical protein
VDVSLTDAELVDVWSVVVVSGLVVPSLVEGGGSVVAVVDGTLVVVEEGKEPTVLVLDAKLPGADVPGAELVGEPPVPGPPGELPPPVPGALLPGLVVVGKLAPSPVPVVLLEPEGELTGVPPGLVVPVRPGTVVEGLVVGTRVPGLVVDDGEPEVPPGWVLPGAPPVGLLLPGKFPPGVVVDDGLLRPLGAVPLGELPPGVLAPGVLELGLEGEPLNEFRPGLPGELSTGEVVLGLEPGEEPPGLPAPGELAPRPAAPGELVLGLEGGPPGELPPGLPSGLVPGELVLGLEPGEKPPGLPAVGLFPPGEPAPG